MFKHLKNIKSEKIWFKALRGLKNVNLHDLNDEAYWQKAAKEGDRIMSAYNKKHRDEMDKEVYRRLNAFSYKLNNSPETIRWK